ncbi:DUF4360 domain-containing protein [Saccharothrix coeruleofusca]|uniref:DUF4360 domain-containing protein n=1 Tax=Saccharothrix coeruleofusca TaxID=33919 RepID=A0A918ANU3_9PSEU|nr:DUF4360 domain-containing protein [Saccharothrix coeruleofusca]MBP2337620.1 hypothetical protein [Saccharothrix coeruleofusca]GGP64624.1 hypothetical protein GCM10010185_41410 [Saccharothrix coeruleofusca]
MLNIVAAALAASVIVIPPGGAPGTTPPLDHITIEVVTVNGSGCPAGTAAVAVSPDNKAFTVTYSDFMAVVGGNADPTAWRKNCQLNLKVNVPSGFTYGIAQADYRGFGHLEPGATGMERANYYFQGMSPTAYKVHNYAGPFSDDWQATDTTELAAIVYHPCGEKRNFNINTELRVSLGTSDPKTTSFMSMDSTDTTIQTTYHFAWKTCP